MNKQEREICKFEMDFKKSLLLAQAVNHPHLQKLRIQFTGKG